MRSSEPTAGWIEHREHLLPVRVYYEDTDFSGVVYHASYARFFERGRSDFLRLAGVAHAKLLQRDAPLALTITRLVIDYRRAARIDDALLVRTAFERLSGPRIFIRQRITRAEEMIAEAEVQVVCIDLQGRARRPPPELAAALGPLLPADPPH